MWCPLTSTLLALVAAAGAYQPYQYGGLAHRQAQRINDQAALNYQRQILEWQRAAAQGQGYNTYASPYLTFRQDGGETAVPPQPTIQAPPPPPPQAPDAGPTAPAGQPQPAPINEVDNSLESTGAPTTVDPLRALCKAPRGQFPGTSCGKFVNCWDDVVVEQDCPLGLFFNEQGSYCDYAFNVPCADQQQPQQPGGAVGAGSGGAEADLGAPDAKCPTEYGTYRSTKNCGVFYMCVGYLPFEFSCPAGLNFHKDLQVCDYPYRVECNGVPTNTVPPEPTTEPEGETTSAPAPVAPEYPAPAPVVVDGPPPPPPTYVDGPPPPPPTYVDGPPPPPPTYVDGSAPPPPPSGSDASQPIVVAEPTPAGPAKFYSYNRRTPINTIGTGAGGCRGNTVYRLNQSCSSVAVCRNGVTQVLNCGQGTAYDVYSKQCVSYLRARC